MIDFFFAQDKIMNYRNPLIKLLDVQREIMEQWNLVTMGNDERERYHANLNAENQKKDEGK